jgi:hypothetical protein
MHWPLDAAQTATAVLSGLSAAIALGAAVATVWFARRNLRRELLNQEINMVSAEIKYFEEFRKWADQVAEALTEAIHLCDLDPLKTTGEPFFERRHRLRITLSSMIDKGRWFFPNIEIDDYGDGKELGYRGYRHELLDSLVSAYRCLQQLDYHKRENNQSLRNDLTAAKRHFVGRVQRILDPDTQRSEWNRIRSKVQPS